MEESPAELLRMIREVGERVRALKAEGSKEAPVAIAQLLRLKARFQELTGEPPARGDGKKAPAAAAPPKASRVAPPAKESLEDDWGDGTPARLFRCVSGRGDFFRLQVRSVPSPQEDLRGLLHHGEAGLLLPGAPGEVPDEVPRLPLVPRCDATLHRARWDPQSRSASWEHQTSGRKITMSAKQENTFKKIDSAPTHLHPCLLSARARQPVPRSGGHEGIQVSLVHEAHLPGAA